MAIEHIVYAAKQRGYLASEESRSQFIDWLAEDGASRGYITELVGAVEEALETSDEAKLTSRDWQDLNELVKRHSVKE